MNKIETLRKKVMSMVPIDDVMFQKMSEDTEFCEEILQTILTDPNLKVIDKKPQNYIRNLQGRSVILDLLCTLGNGKQVNVEVQKPDNDNHQKRIRYNASCITANITSPGIKFRNVPDLICIYISRFEVHKTNRPIFHVVRTIQETGEILNNGFQEIYVNAAIDDGSNLAELMKVFTIDHYYSKNFPKTSSLKHHYKKTRKGVTAMCEIVEELKRQSNAELIVKHIDLNMKNYHVTLEQACTNLDITVDDYLAAKQLLSEWEEA